MVRTKESLRKPSPGKTAGNVANPLPVPGKWWLPIAIALLLGAITIAVYLPVRHYGFLNWDDFEYVKDNYHVKDGFTWGGIIWSLTQSYSGNWHPLTWMSHMLDCQLFGLKAGAHHVTNLIFHTANTLLLFVLLRRMTGALWRSAFVAALFALHPLHVESVAWVSERKDVLSGFFFMLTLLAYERYVSSVECRVSAAAGRTRVTRHPSLRYALALVFFALGLMSKPMLVTLPFVLLLLDYWPLGRLKLNTENWKRTTALLREKLPFFALTVASSAVTIWAQKKRGAVGTWEQFPIETRVQNALVAYVQYLTKSFWPSRLSPIYPHPDRLEPWVVTGAAVILLAISLAAWRGRRRFPFGLMGWLWYLGTLVPVIGLVQVGGQAFADRYTYIPLIGIMIALVWLGANLISLLPLRSRPRHRAGAGTEDEDERRCPSVIACSLAAALSLAVLAALSWRTTAQIAFWKDTEPLFRRALALNPSNAQALDCLGAELVRTGRIEEGKQMLEEAVRLKPAYADAWASLATALDTEGRYGEAVNAYQRSLAIRPDQPGVYNNLAWLRATCPEPAFRDKAEAVRLATQACEMSDYSEPLFIGTLAAAQADAGDLEGALATERRLVSLASTLRSEQTSRNARLVEGNLKYYKGAALQRDGKGLEGLPYLQEAVVSPELQPERDYRLGLSLIEANRLPEAEKALREAVAAKPDSADFQLGMAALLHRQGQLAKAEQLFRNVVAQHPELAQARKSFADFLMLLDRPAEAEVQYAAAVKLRPEDVKIQRAYAAALNDLAWSLATNPDDHLRNGARAVELAERSCQLTEWKQPLLMGTLAAAYAEAGRFADAVATAVKARDKARGDKMEEVAKRNEELLQLYRAGKAYHESH